MKKVILGLFTVTFLLFSIKSDAQFTLEHDTISATYSSGLLKLENHVINSSSSPVTLEWSVVAHDFPASWSGNNLGICDNYNCYTNGQGSLTNMTWKTTSPYAANETSGIFYLQIDLSGSGVVTGTHYMTVNMKDESNSSNQESATFIVSKFPTGLTSVTKSTDDVVLYPNPARDELNVIFDPKNDIRNIAVYNVIGKAMVVYRVSGSNAKLDINKLPSGVYFIRLSDAKGQVVSTKRFTKQ